MEEDTRESMMESIAEKYRADAIAAQKECDAWSDEYLKLIDELRKLIDKLSEVEAERDAYRDLCGKMRKMANEMLVMEVD